MRRLAPLLAVVLLVPLLDGCTGSRSREPRPTQAAQSSPRSQAEFITWTESRRRRLTAELTECEDDLMDEKRDLGSEPEQEILRGRRLLGELRAVIWRASQASPEEFEGMRWRIEILLADIDSAMAGACL